MNTIPKSLDEDIDRVFQLGDDLDADQNSISNVPSDDDTGDDDVGGDDGAASQSQQNTQQGDGQQDDDDLAGLPPSDNFNKLPRDAKGNILDKDGNILAATRQDKRLLFMYNKVRGNADRMRTQLESAARELQSYRQLADIQSRYKLDAAAIAEAAQFRAQFDINPVQTVREIVAQAVANGYTMEQLFGPDAPAAINASVIERTIDTKLRPLTERMQNANANERAEAEAREAFEDFIARHEYADVHGNEIAHIVNTERVSPEVAYYKLQSRAAQLGLDFSQNLVEQMIAREKGGGGNGQQRTNGQQQPQRRMLPGNRTAGGHDASPAPAAPQVADPSTPFKDIVRQAMRSVASRQAN